MNIVDTALRLPPLSFVDRATLRRWLLDPPVGRLYWRVAPAVHRHRRYRRPGYVDPPVDPFGLVAVDPDRITRFTGRAFPAWEDRWEQFGAVEGGDWDRRTDPPVTSTYRGPTPSAYLAERFEETPLHRALAAHFRDGVAWDELPFVRERLAEADPDEKSVWHECSTPAEIRAHCRDLDRLYERMAERGCRPMRELNAARGRPRTVREVMEHEILVDVSRDGEPLFVTGRHRLSIAKLLGLERVPVGVVVRHADRFAGADGDPDTALGEPLDVAW